MTKLEKAAVVEFVVVGSETDWLEIFDAIAAADVAFGEDLLESPLHVGDGYCGKGQKNGGGKTVRWQGVEINDFLPKVESQMQKEVKDAEAPT